MSMCKENKPSNVEVTRKLDGLDGARENEVDITPAMVDAGVRELWDSGWFEQASPSDYIIVKRVFRAMALARTISAQPLPISPTYPHHLRTT